MTHYSICLPPSLACFNVYVVSDLNPIATMSRLELLIDARLCARARPSLEGQKNDDEDIGPASKAMTHQSYYDCFRMQMLRGSALYFLKNIFAEPRTVRINKIFSPH